MDQANEMNPWGEPTAPIPLVVPHQPVVRGGWIRWTALVGVGLLVATGTYFLGRWTKGNAQEAAYRQQETLLAEAQHSLNVQRAVFEQRQVQLAEERASLNGTQATLSHQQASLAKQQATLAQQESNLRSALATLSHDQAVLAQQQATLNSTKAQVAQQEGALKQQQSTLQGQQATLQQELDAVKATQFGNGLFEVGRDIKAGTYHTSGAQAGTQCSWAQLSSDNPADAVAKNTATGPQTVTIGTPFFLSQGCTNWTKVG